MSGASGIIVILSAPVSKAAWWLHVIDGQIVSRAAVKPVDEVIDFSRSMLVLPVTATTVHRYALPDMSPQQGRGVARRMAMEVSLDGDEPLHAVAADNFASGTQHVVATVAPALMADALAWAGNAGFDPDIIIPAGMILPEPESGFVRGVIGAESVARGEGICLPGSDALAEAIIGDAEVSELSREAMDAAFIAAFEDPEINLRVEPFAKRVQQHIEASAFVRIAIWAGFVALASLLISLLQIARYRMDTHRLDEETIAAARPLLPAANDAALAEQELKSRLAASGGSAYAFTGAMAAIVNAMRPFPSVALTLTSRASDGSIRATLASARAQDIDGVVNALQAAGFAASTTTSADPGGRIVATVTVAP